MVDLCTLFHVTCTHISQFICQLKTFYSSMTESVQIGFFITDQAYPSMWDFHYKLMLSFLYGIGTVIIFHDTFLKGLV